MTGCTCVTSPFSPYRSVRGGVQADSDGQGRNVGEGGQELIAAHGVARLDVPELAVNHRYGNHTLSKRRDEEEARDGT